MTLQINPGDPGNLACRHCTRRRKFCPRYTVGAETCYPRSGSEVDGLEFTLFRTGGEFLLRCQCAAYSPGFDTYREAVDWAVRHRNTTHARPISVIEYEEVAA